MFPTVAVDPTNLASDLGEVRLKFKHAFAELAKVTEELLAPLPLTSMTPKWVARRAAANGTRRRRLCRSVAPTSASTDPAVNRPDGTDAACASGRSLEPGVTKRTLERMEWPAVRGFRAQPRDKRVDLDQRLPGPPTGQHPQEALRAGHLTHLRRIRSDRRDPGVVTPGCVAQRLATPWTSAVIPAIPSKASMMRRR